MKRGLFEIITMNKTCVAKQALCTVSTRAKESGPKYNYSLILNTVWKYKCLKNYHPDMDDHYDEC